MFICFLIFLHNLCQRKRTLFFITHISELGLYVTKYKNLLFRPPPKRTKGLLKYTPTIGLSGLGGKEGVMVAPVEYIWE